MHYPNASQTLIGMGHKPHLSETCSIARPSSQLKKFCQISSLKSPPTQLTGSRAQHLPLFLLLMELWITMRSPLGLLLSKTDNLSVLSYFSEDMPSSSFTFVALLLMLSRTFISFYIVKSRTVHNMQGETTLTLNIMGELSLAG